MKRKFLCLFLVLSLLMGMLLTSCADAGKSDSTESDGISSEATTQSSPPTETEKAPSDTNQPEDTDTPSDTSAADVTEESPEQSLPTSAPTETDSDTPSFAETETDVPPTEETTADDPPVEETTDAPPAEETTDEPPAEETTDEPPAQTEGGSSSTDPADGSFGAYKHVVVLGVDGGGDFLHDTITLPQISSIFEGGAVTYTAQTAYPSISAQCWGSLLHGVTPAKHKLNNTSAGQNPYPNNSPYPSIFRVIREASPDADLASFCAWGTINKGIVEDGIGVHKVSGGGDTNITSGAAAYFKENLPTFMFVQLNDVDVALHEHGFGSNECILALRRSDVRINEIWRAIQTSGAAEDTLFIVTADHGGNGTDHGGSSAGEMNILFAVAGRTVQSGTIGEMEIRDTASIVLYALGIAPSPNWTSRVPSGLFEGVEASERPAGDSPAHRTQASQPTPTVDSGAYLTDLVDQSVRAYLTFDGSANDAMGNVSPTEKNTVTYVDGFFGEAANLNGGYVSIPDCNFGTSSFSVAFWMNTKGTNSDPAVFSNKDWTSSSNVGFALALRVLNDFRFSFCDGTTKSDSIAPLPISYDEGWTHVILSVDRESSRVSISYDFGKFTVTNVPTALSDYSLDTEYPVNIGQDGTGNGRVKFSGTIDEFIIFEGALDAEDVKALASYYGIG